MMSKEFSEWESKQPKEVLTLARQSYLLQRIAGVPAVGQTKCGGKPDLPEGATWPSFKGQPMSFIAQFNCVEFSEIDDSFPKEGLLSFFRFFPDPNEDVPLVYSNEDPASFLVSYFPADTRLKQKHYPDNLWVNYRFRTSLLKAVRLKQYPDASAFEYKKGKQLATELDQLDLIQDGLFDEQASAGGYPQESGNVIISKWVKQFLGDTDGLNADTVSEFSETFSNDFLCLLQFYMDDGLFLNGVFTEYEPLGTGKMAIGIRKQNLKEGNWNKVSLCELEEGE